MKLIEDWPLILWRSATTWVAAAIGAVVGVVGAHWALLLGVLPFLPFWLQLPLAIAVGVITIAGPVVVARITEQPRLNAKIEERKRRGPA